MFGVSLLWALAAPPAPAGPKTELEFGARMVVRPEARANATLGTQPQDEEWRVRQSARIHGGARYGPLRAVVQLQDVRQWGDGSSTLSDDPFTGAHQAFGEVGRARSEDEPRQLSGYLRVGRQEVALWQSRLIGVRPWQPANQALNAVRGRIDYGRFGFEVAGAILDAPGTLTFGDDTTTTTLRTSGELMAWSEVSMAVRPAFTAHAGVIGLRRDATLADPTRDQRIATPGLYLHGVPWGGLDYDVEGYAQVGRTDDQRHLAWLASAAVGYTFDIATKPGLRLEYSVASGSACEGDPDAGDACQGGTVRDFEQHYGNRHGIRGFADLFALTNVRDLHARASLDPDPMVTLWVDYHWLQLHESTGRWINTGGRPAGSVAWDPTNTQNTVGHEVDLLATFKPWKPLSMRPGYSVFIPTGAGRTLGGDQALHFVYLWLVLDIRGRWSPGAEPVRK
ncbi:MAG: alginate export family protein [Nannocystaceae bacterium]|nr:alginate export family protein [bacterium]